jgi:ElaB protein
MEPNIHDQPQPLNPTGAATSTARATSDGGQTVTDKVNDAAHAAREQVEDRSAEIINQAKQKASEAYDQANKKLSEQYEKAINYGRENPGKTTLIALGVGVGVGALLVSNFSASRSRRSRMVGPVMKLVSTLARELFR